MVIYPRTAQALASKEVSTNQDPDTFGPNTALNASKESRSLDVIRSLDFETEVKRASILAEVEGLRSVKLKLNGIEISVKQNEDVESARLEFLNVAGKRRESGYDITNPGSQMLEDRVYTACLAARLLEPACEFVVFDFNEPGKKRFGPTVVTRNTDPEDVLQELIGR